MARPGPEAAGVARCEWVGDDPLMVAYHDAEWGTPVHDERHLFEMLCLEGAQAGLSWSTILRRREGYRAAYEGFDPERVATFDEARQAALVQDPRIVRNRAKVTAFRENARATLRLRDEAGGLDAYLWAFVGGAPIVGRHRSLAELPAETPLARALSADLRGRGFRFVGPVIVYAFMQAVGLVNDHVLGCFRHPGRLAPGDPAD
jgi:DNA-3-methyladenine glycosylase I